MSENVAAALDAFRSVVGAEHVVTGVEALKPYHTATFATEVSVPAVVRPADTAQVQACLRVANEHGVPVYPISTGLNSGYGSRVPTADAVVLELKRMDRIVAFSADLAYVTIEPGVSQAQLYDYLQQHGGGRLWMDVTGAYRAHSVIGNIMERGFGHTPYADHFANVGGMQLVLPDGELVHTGFGRFGNATGTGVYRYGVGPMIDGLFTQSNFGVCTQLTLWLMPAPEYVQSVSCSVPTRADLPALIDALRPLRLDGTIDSAMHIGNDYKVLSSVHRYPWAAVDGRTPLDLNTTAKMAKGWGFGAWNVSGAIYGSRADVARARRRIRRALRGKVKSLRFLDENMIKLAGLVSKPYYWVTGVKLEELLKVARPVFGMTRGEPSDDIIASTYWRKPAEFPASLDPEADGCGLMWLAVIAPTEGQHAAKLYAIVEECMLRHGFEPATSITLFSGRALDCVVSIGWDRDIAGEDARALACYDEMLQALMKAGYYPYRLSLRGMGQLPPAIDASDRLTRGIKDLVDPKGILAPGRYL